MGGEVYDDVLLHFSIHDRGNEWGRKAPQEGDRRCPHPHTGALATAWLRLLYPRIDRGISQREDSIVSRGI